MAQGINPRGLQPNELWQMDVKHCPELSPSSFLHVCINTNSSFIWATRLCLAEWVMLPWGCRWDSKDLGIHTLPPCKYGSTSSEAYALSTCCHILFMFLCVCVFVHMHARSLQLCLTLCDPMDCSLPGSSVHEDSPGKNTGVGCHALFQGIFLTQESNLRLLRILHWQAGSLPLQPSGRPPCELLLEMRWSYFYCTMIIIK